MLHRCDAICRTRAALPGERRGPAAAKLRQPTPRAGQRMMRPRPASQPASSRQQPAVAQHQLQLLRPCGTTPAPSCAATAAAQAQRRAPLPPPRAFLADAPPQRSGAAELLERLAVAPSAAPAPDGSHPVLRLMQQRLRAGGAAGAPGRRPDGCKIGLVVEGGGMRGIVTGAPRSAAQARVAPQLLTRCCLRACLAWPQARC